MGRDVQNESIIQLLLQFNQLVQERLEQTIELPLSIPQLSAVDFIARHEHSAMKELARYLSITPASTSALIKKLEARGTVVRTVDPEDGRIVRLALTEDGAEALQQVHAEVADQLTFFVEALSAGEQQQLYQILLKMIGSAG